MSSLFKNHQYILVNQIKEMLEIVIDWETGNKYEILDEDKNKIGFAAEKSGGIFRKILRNIFRSHRHLIIDVWDNNPIPVYKGIRPFYFFFSDLKVFTMQRNSVGEIKTRFGILKRKYDLIDGRGNVFARIESPRWRLWTFKIFNAIGNEAGVISKKWGGVLKEALTDADKFVIDLSKDQWTEDQKAVLLYACLSIDLDFFEDNSGSLYSIRD